MSPETYTCRGPVRGSCGHRHRTFSGALRCLARDKSGCRQQGGYSDRDVYGDRDGVEVEYVEISEGAWVTREEIDEMNCQDWMPR